MVFYLESKWNTNKNSNAMCHITFRFFSPWIIKCYGCQLLGARWGNKTSHVLCPIRCTFREHLRGTVSEPGFNLGICGLWSHHTSTAPLWCHMLLTYYQLLSIQNKKNCIYKLFKNLWNYFKMKILITIELCFSL